MSAFYDLSAFYLRATIKSVTLTIVLCTEAFSAGAIGTEAVDVGGFETVAIGAGAVVVRRLTAETLGAGVLDA